MDSRQELIAKPRPVKPWEPAERIAARGQLDAGSTNQLHVPPLRQLPRKLGQVETKDSQLTTSAHHLD